MSGRLSRAQLDALEDRLGWALNKLREEERPTDPARRVAELLLQQPDSGGANLPPRPAGASGTFLRVITVNDSYTLANYARVASAVNEARESARRLDCVVTSTMNGDFLSPSQLTALDGGRAMIDGLNHAQIEFLCLGNHEFDVPHKNLRKALGGFRGTCLNSNCETEALAHLPRFARLRVGERVAVFAGLCIADPSIYLPGHGFGSAVADRPRA